MSETLTPEQKAQKDVDLWRKWLAQEGFPAPKGGWKKLFEEKRRYHHYWDVVLAGLSNRTRNTVYSSCFPKTKEQIRQEVMSGTLDFNKQRNCGKKTIAEIFKWLGLLLKGQEFVSCPCCHTRLVYSKRELFQLSL